MSKVSYLDIALANEQIKPTDIKGKDYAEVNQRIKAFRMLYPEGFLLTKDIQINDGMCVITTECGYYKEDCDGTIQKVVLGEGIAYEKEGSTFINKTSFIENCQTSSWGRCLSCLALGIDTSVASAEEVANAINNQTVTQEDADNYTITFGKHKGKKLNEVPTTYIQWLLGNSNDEHLKKCIELATGMVMPSEEEQEEGLKLQVELNDALLRNGVDHTKLLKHYGVESTSQLTIEQMKDAISKLG